MNWRGTKRQRVWYGLTATVVIGPGFRHEAGFGRFLIPHPPVANWLLRKGLRQPEARQLAFLHEIGHFQTAPITLLWLAANAVAASASGNLTWVIGAFLLVSNHAAWEMLAEMVVAMRNRPYYRQSYQGNSKVPRLVFWITATTVSLAGSLVAIP